VKERKGPFGLMVGGIVDSVVQTARRRAQGREPRATVYNAAGMPRVLRPDDPGREELIETAARLIELTGVPPVEEEPADADAQVAEAEAEAEARAAREADDGLSA
jgi:nucleotide-binding universal stress UspA family protein